MFKNGRVTLINKAVNKCEACLVEIGRHTKLKI